MAASKKNNPAAASPGPEPAPVPAATPAKLREARQSETDAKVEAARVVLADTLAKAQAMNLARPPAEKPIKTAKAKKGRLVRDSFTMPEDEYAQLPLLKKRLAANGVAVKKSELLRAGVALLAALKDAELTAAVAKVEKIKTGRPAKETK